MTTTTAADQRSDDELLAEFRLRRCDRAFAEIVARHGMLVLAACRRILRDEHAADDAAQAAFLVLAVRPQAVDAGFLAGWLHAVARRTALDHARALKRRRQREVGGRPERQPEIAPVGDAECLRAEIDDALARIPAQLREAVLLCHLEGRTQREAAEIAGCPIGTMGWRAAKGLERLRQILRRGGLVGKDSTYLGLGLLALRQPASEAQLAFLRAAMTASPHATTLAASGLATGAAAKLGLWLASGAIAAAAAILAAIIVRDRVHAPAAAAATATATAHARASEGEDAIADFTPPATIVSVADGAWSSTATWLPHRVPGAGDAVAIASGTTVAYDLASDAHLAAVSVRDGGELRFRTDIGTRLVADAVLIHGGGGLSMGSADDPVREGASAELVIADAPLDPLRDPHLFGDGLVVLGALRMHGSLRTAIVRLADEPKMGDRSLRLQTAPQGWRVGDRLGLPDTRHLDWNEHGGGRYASQWEDAILAGLSADGTVVRLASPLAFAHGGARGGDGVLDDLPHVVDQTRNVVVRSLDPNGRRGHVWASGRAEINLRYAAFIGLGRSTSSQTLPTDESRCALRFQRLLGPAAPAADGHQFTLIGNVVDGLVSTAGGARGGIMLDAACFGLIEGNIVRDVAGVGIELAAGSSRNELIGNFVTAVHGNGELYGSGADPGIGYSVRDPDNVVRDNVANGMPDGPYACGFDVDCGADGTQPVLVTSTPGREPDQRIRMSALRLREFVRNEAYGALGTGIRTLALGASRAAAETGAGTIGDCRVWHQYAWAMFGITSRRLTYERFSARGNPANREACSTGMFFSDAPQRDLAIIDADIQGEAVGIQVPSLVESPTLIEGGRLANATDILVPTPSAFVGGQIIRPRRTIVRNVSFLEHGAAARRCIVMGFGDGGGCNCVAEDVVLVYGFDRIPGDDFRVYYREQGPDFIVPVSSRAGRPIIGCPEAGLSNAASWRKYGIAVAGSIAPTTATRPGIVGLVGAIPAEPGPR